MQQRSQKLRQSNIEEYSDCIHKMPYGCTTLYGFSMLPDFLHPCTSKKHVQEINYALLNCGESVPGYCHVEGLSQQEQQEESPFGCSMMARVVQVEPTPILARTKVPYKVFMPASAPICFAKFTCTSTYSMQLSNCGTQTLHSNQCWPF